MSAQAQERGGEGATAEDEATSGGAASKPPPNTHTDHPVEKDDILQENNYHFDFCTFILTTETSSFA